MPAVRRFTPKLLFSIAWVAVAATTLLGAACLREALARPVRFPGFLTYASGAVAAISRPGWASWSEDARVHVRDVVTAVDGRDVRGGRALAAALAEACPGPPCRVR